MAAALSPFRCLSRCGGGVLAGRAEKGGRAKERQCVHGPLSSPCYNYKSLSSLGIHQLKAFYLILLQLNSTLQVNLLNLSRHFDITLIQSNRLPCSQKMPCTSKSQTQNTTRSYTFSVIPNTKSSPL